MCGSLRGNKLGVEGGKAIAEALRVNEALTSVNLLGNKIDDETATMLLKLKKEKSALTTLCGLKPDQDEADFTGWGLGPVDAKLLAPEIGVSEALTKIEYAAQNLAKPQTRRSRLPAGPTHAPTLTDHSARYGSLSWNKLGPEGGKAVADALRVNEALTKI